MYKYLISGGKRESIFPSYTGPGPQELIGYYQDPNNPERVAGFYGEVPIGDFIDGTVLASRIGLTDGAITNSDTPWLKFLLDGQILFFPKKTLRANVRWRRIYEAGAVYGDDTYGHFDVTGTKVLQNKKVEIGGSLFSVGLPRGSSHGAGFDSTNPVNDPEASWGSEWNRLFYNITSQANKTSQEGLDWASYSISELGMNSGYGRWSWCVEYSSNYKDSTFRALRGGGSVTAFCTLGMSYQGYDYGWRPKLELVV